MITRERLYTADEFFQLAAAPDYEALRLELDDGVIVDVGSSSRLNTVTAGRILTALNNFVLPRDLGYVTGADGGYKLGVKRVRRPDVGFISKTRGGTLEGVEFNGAPDLAVEVVSPDEDILKKAQEYLSAGGKMVWAVYAEDQIVYVMRHDQDGEHGNLRVRAFRPGDTLSGEDVLPTFTLPVDDVFPI